jgi:hypothetical protein
MMTVPREVGGENQIAKSRSDKIQRSRKNETTLPKKMTNGNGKRLVQKAKGGAKVAVNQPLFIPNKFVKTRFCA